MPRVRWGDDVTPDTVDNWDRESQIRPYDGPPVPNGLYYFDIKVLRYVDGANYPQLRVGLELVPRRSRPDDKKYKGFFIMAFLPVANQTAFRYVPFLDALGVTGREFINGTVTDEEGNITKIGKWVKKKSGNWIAATLVSGTDAQGNPRQEVGSFYAPASPSDSRKDESEEEAYEEDEAVDDYDETEADAEQYEEEVEEVEEVEEEPEPPRPAKKVAKKVTVKKAPATAARKPARPATEEYDETEPPF